MAAVRQKELVETITSVHKKLRKSYHECGNIDEVWQKHLLEKEERAKYSSAMYELATKVWTGKECRIKWSFNLCMEYFFLGGVERALKRQLTIEMYKNQADSNLNLPQMVTIPNNYAEINRKLKLLDVGSCYNPFAKFSILECTAIDLTPATDDVLKVDFLSLHVESQSGKDITANQSANDLPLFFENNFDVVVLSLVFEYLPAAEQRAQFCIKAFQLLQQNGLCIIIFPDAKAVHHNVPMIKSWGKGMEKIGFVRVKYEKLTYLQCLAFRKKYNSLQFNPEERDALNSSFYLPQDFKVLNECGASHEEYHERTSDEDIKVSDNFSHLPFF